MFMRGKRYVFMLVLNPKKVLKCIIKSTKNLKLNILHFLSAWCRFMSSSSTLNCTDPNPPDPSRGICCPSCKGNSSLQRDQILQSYLVKRPCYFHALMHH